MLQNLAQHSKIDDRMRDMCATFCEPENSARIAVEHHLAAGGNRLRASICLDASARLGIIATDAIVLATVCELLHNASLVHDDLLDRESTRRGGPSVWVAFGDDVAVCSGDLMLSASYGAVGKISDPAMLPDLIRLIHRRASEVIAGQCAENAAKSAVSLTMLQYENLALGKSASLLTLPLELPLFVSGNSASLGRAGRAASAFSIAYQMADDLEDFDADQRAGSLNVVTVVQGQDSCGYEQARSIVRKRAAILFQVARKEASLLPFECGSILEAHATTALKGLAADQLRGSAMAESL